MFRPTALRTATRASAQALSLPTTRQRAAQRFASSSTRRSPVDKPRGWKSAVARWGAAGAVVWWYNTAVVFAEEPGYPTHAPPVATESNEPRPLAASATASSSTPASSPDPATEPAEAEEQAGQEGAFNEETGEINWDCPCLGGMAHGPCGEQFREAFSCFVFSTEEPKGVDCIDKFKGMQDCFREHPDVYGGELEGEELEGIGEEGSGTGEKEGTPVAARKEVDGEGKRVRAEAAREQVQRQHPEAESETPEAVPKAWHDTTAANDKA